jgi:ribosomal protein S18 acetylase RimI-like enzyme
MRFLARGFLRKYCGRPSTPCGFGFDIALSAWLCSWLSETAPIMILLSPMTETEFSAHMATAIPDYAVDMAKCGEWAEAASLGLSQKDFDTLLPSGFATPDHYFYNLQDATTRGTVGRLWFGVRERGGVRIAYVYDILVFTRYRRKGYATEAFRALESEVKKLGLPGIGLHVFGHNPGAQVLYQKLGFQPTNMKMFKRIT